MLISPSSLVCGLLALAATTSAAAVAPSPEDISPELFGELLQKRANNVAITGTKDDSGVKARLSIRVLAQDPDMWNLFLVSMRDFKNMDQADKMSYYQVAGVHGVPNVAWDGVDGVNAAGSDQPPVGYCTHSSEQFPPWHRAYLALYEQAFKASVTKTANSFQGDLKQRYQSVARDMRIPYWDWSQGPTKFSQNIPTQLTDQYVEITDTDGSKQRIPNPLYQYDFHPLDKPGMLMDPFQSWDYTRRWPNSQNADASTQSSQVIQNIQAQSQNFRDQIYNVFTQCGEYSEFSNDAATAATPQCQNSLEGIHNTIHNTLGGSNYGHMTWLWWAAFDPIFWIHHANVDRLFAMWQTLYPDSYMGSSKTTGGSFVVPQNTAIDGNTPLYPFHNSTEGNFWTGNGVRDLAQFGYTYTELQQANGNADTLKNIINNLYGGSTQQTSSPTRRSFLPRRNEVQPFGNATGLLTPTGRKYDYTANIITERFGMDGSFTFYCFLGNHSDDATRWGYDPSLVGSYGVFSNMGMRMGSNQHLISGSVPLTTALVARLQRGELKSLEEEDVMPYLQKQLSWGCVDSKGQKVDNADVPGLQVSIFGCEVKPAVSDETFPTWGKWNPIPKVTDGKKGGLKVDQPWDHWNPTPSVPAVSPASSTAAALPTAGYGSSEIPTQPAVTGSPTAPSDAPSYPSAGDSSIAPAPSSYLAGDSSAAPSPSSYLAGSSGAVQPTNLPQVSGTPSPDDKGFKVVIEYVTVTGQCACGDS